MSKIFIPRVVRPVDLGAYSPELRLALTQAEQEGKDSKPIRMWVNPTRTLLDRYNALMGRTDDLVRRTRENTRVSVRNANRTPEQQALPPDPLPHDPKELQASWDKWDGEFFDWWAEAWSQDPDEKTHWTADEVRAFAKECEESDPELYQWVHRTCTRMMADYRTNAKNS